MISVSAMQTFAMAHIERIRQRETLSQIPPSLAPPEWFSRQDRRRNLA